MSSNREEKERTQRIQDAQIRARDPGASKIKGYDWEKHGKRAQQIKKNNQKPLIIAFFDVLPSRWKGALVGVVLGLIPLIAALIFLEGEWKVFGLIPLLIFGVVGFIIGATISNEVPH